MIKQKPVSTNKNIDPGQKLQQNLNLQPQSNNNEAIQLRQLLGDPSSAASASQMMHLQKSIGNRATALLIQRKEKKENKTGLPDNLKTGVENLSGLSLDDVNVHYNSAKPSELQALAYAQGTDIHVGPGQEQHLPHEAWHVAQQKQGRVKPTLKMNSNVQINDDSGLEQEADQMGAKSMQFKLGETESPRAADQTHSDVVQLRGENPHAKAGAHGGWDLTAHHIIAHSKLVEAFGKLSAEDKAEILRDSIPSKLTKSMLDNMKVNLEDTEEARDALRVRLVSKEESDDAVVSEIRLGDIRTSFFEWQGGNQYQGPNTSIRTEPTSNKDDIDYDGQYFGNLDKETFDKMTGLGEKLDDKSQEDKIKDNLKEILKITKNQIPNVFDASKWTEIDSIATLNELSKNTDLNREHILNYSFFKLGMDEIGAGKKYAEITGASGDYSYSMKKIELQVKGTAGYIPLIKAQNTVPAEKSTKPLIDIMNELGVEKRVDKTNYVIKVDGDLISLAGKKFKIKGYEDSINSIPYIKSSADEIEASKVLVDKKQMAVVKTLKSLYTYCEESGMPTSSFLPKALYESLKKKEAITNFR